MFMVLRHIRSKLSNECVVLQNASGVLGANNAV